MERQRLAILYMKIFVYLLIFSALITNCQEYEKISLCFLLSNEYRLEYKLIIAKFQ